MADPLAPLKLKRWRDSLGWTQAQAAAHFGVARRTWHQWEAGSVVPGGATMIDIYVETRGAICPNDYFPLPDIQVNREAA